MALRHKSKRKPLFSLDALTGEPEGRLLAEEVIRTEERNRILHFCMDEINPDYREVLYLTYFEGMSYAQAAEVTGKTVKQITNMVYRGKESLRRLLERRESQMRSHEERVAETKRRIAKMEREKRLRRNTVTMASAVAACLALLIGASLAMPGIAANIQTGDYSGFETAASTLRRRGFGIHRHRAFGVFTWRVRDRSVLPHPAAQPRERAGQGK